MKLYILLLTALLLISGCGRDNSAVQLPDRDLVIYTGEPFMTESIWNDLSYFEAKYNCRLLIKNFPDIWQVLDSLKQEADSTDADVICGINSALVVEAVESGLFGEYKSENLKFIDSKFCFDKTNHFTPYAYGYLGLLYDSRYIANPPRNYGELQDNCWDEALIMPDPEKTGMGRAFLHQTAAQFGKNGFRYLWQGIKKNISIYPLSYNDAYKRFLAGEGYLIPAYTTMSLFHSQSRSDYYKVVVLEEGTFLVEEFAGITAATDKLVLAQRFIDYLLSEDFQSRICPEKWMYPVHRNVELAAEFAEVRQIAKDEIYSMSAKTVKAEEKTWLKKLKSDLGRN
ncbi:MAG: thiamine ABC transporter substrate-binding protein [Candidatus Cloacimonetes bacterium]|nr:thiamine ABC transporter substrate-binding protein [Candidatus Cloacimonadota bacterium]